MNKRTHARTGGRRNPFPVVARFWLNVEPGASDDECWLWRGTKDREGYGHFVVMGLNASEWRVVKAHRFAYELERGAVPRGLHLDHLCREHSCVNPAHLEAVTNRENVLRGVGWGALNASKTHCKRGHEFTPENTGITADGRRRCRPCKKILDRRYAEQRRALTASQETP